MKTKRKIVMIILVIVGIWLAAIATHYVSVAWYRSKFAAKWEKPLAQEYKKSRKQPRSASTHCWNTTTKNTKCFRHI